MKNIIVDYENGEISISSAFKKKAFTPGTAEYKLLNTVRRDYPEFALTVRQFQTNNQQDRYKGLTYDYMRWYIVTKDSDHAPEMIKALEDQIDISKCHSTCKRYPSIKAWFLKSYPAVAKFGMNEVELAEWEAAQKSNVTSLPAGADGKAA